MAAALDCFMELDPVGDLAASRSEQPQPPNIEPAGASAGAGAAAWAWKQQQRLKAAAAAQEAEARSEDEASCCTSSPGCSYSSGGGAAIEASLLDLTDDACSAPRPLPHAQSPAPQQPHLLPNGTPIVAATFFDDLAARGSVYQYCLQR